VYLCVRSVCRPGFTNLDPIVHQSQRANSKFRATSMFISLILQENHSDKSFISSKNFTIFNFKILDLHLALCVTRNLQVRADSMSVLLVLGNEKVQSCVDF
jgi:hypothetical protein